MKVKEESEKVGLKLNIQKTKIIASGSHQLMTNRWGNSGWLYFLRLQNHCRWWLQPWSKRCLLLGRKALTNLDNIKKQRHHFADKVHLVKAIVFSSSNVWMWELYHKESWVLNNWCFWTVVLEKTLGSPLDCKGIKPVNPKGNQSWIFIGRTDAEAKAPILWPLDAKNWLIRKDPDAGKDWGQEKGTTEDEKVGWHNGLNGHEFEQALRYGEGQGSLGCCSPWIAKSWMQLGNWTTIAFKFLSVFWLSRKMHFFSLEIKVKVTRSNIAQCS